MITNIEIVNFRSIQNTKIKLEPLTTIVGANSTGKSNLIKALDFISDIAQFGLNEAVYKRGGFDEILPKQFLDISNREIYFKINLELGLPDNWPSEYGKINAYYELSIEKGRGGKLKIKKESLFLDSVLLVAYFFEKRFNEKENKNKIEVNLENLNELKNSNFIIERVKLGKLMFNTNIDLEGKNVDLLLGWIGIKRFFESRNDKKRTSSKNLSKIINSLINNVRPGARTEDIPIVSIDRVVFQLCGHLRRLNVDLESIARYDLFINELRQEQLISITSSVSVTGDNIPSVLKYFVKEEKESWDRMVTTMSNISPYFLKVYSESLRAGKEYLMFEEIFNGRPIESWEASDGTLRALAILLSLESQKEGSTILIEEPEHGLHPWAVKDLMVHIKETIRLKNIQVILTTHSSQVLECINQNELLVTERDEFGTTYSTLDKIIPDKKLNMGEIGQLWTRGLLKGVPTSFE